mmetsp:Transcript_28743/g.93438  ORF Transcript_28743/g.93438 Transcript_28743/m.93438 type:complete len:224 (+) Transcript_28743:2150-2821(+)
MRYALSGTDTSLARSVNRGAGRGMGTPPGTMNVPAIAPASSSAPASAPSPSSPSSRRIGCPSSSYSTIASRSRSACSSASRICSRAFRSSACPCSDPSTSANGEKSWNESSGMPYVCICAATAGCIWDMVKRRPREAAGLEDAAAGGGGAAARPSGESGGTLLASGDPTCPCRGISRIEGKAPSDGNDCSDMRSFGALVPWRKSSPWYIDMLSYARDVALIEI